MTKWSIERVVTILTPIFAAAAAALTGWLGAHFPGVHVPPDQLVALEVAGFSGAVAAALKWLHGRQKFVAFTDEAQKTLEDALAKLKTELAANPQATLALSDLEAMLKAHASQVEQAIDTHVPKAVGQALQALFAQLGGSPSAPVSTAPAPPPAPVTAP